MVVPDAFEIDAFKQWKKQQKQPWPLVDGAARPTYAEPRALPASSSVTLPMWGDAQRAACQRLDDENLHRYSDGSRKGNQAFRRTQGGLKDKMMKLADELAKRGAPVIVGGFTFPRKGGSKLWAYGTRLYADVFNEHVLKLVTGLESGSLNMQFIDFKELAAHEEPPLRAALESLAELEKHALPPDLESEARSAASHALEDAHRRVAAAYDARVTSTKAQAELTATRKKIVDIHRDRDMTPSLFMTAWYVDGGQANAAAKMSALFAVARRWEVILKNIDRSIPIWFQTKKQKKK